MRISLSIPVIFATSHLLQPTSALPTRTRTASLCDDLADEIAQAVREGRLSLARSIAVAAVSDHSECENLIARKYVEVSNAKLTEGENYLSLVDSIARSQSAKDTHKPVMTRQDPTPCWDGGQHLEDATGRWDTCCSSLVSRNAAKSSTDFMSSSSLHSSSGSDATKEGAHECHDISGLPLCCDFFSGSPSHLRLPALREVALNVRVSLPPKDANSTSNNVTLSLEQDGFLRPYDVSSILWPAGYLLTLCVASPTKCGAIELSKAIEFAVLHGKQRKYLAIELGAGVGGPSIATSLYIQQIMPILARDSAGIESSRSSLVVATDTALHSLALITSNARTNSALVETVCADYNNLTALSKIKRKMGGFAVVLGSSLQAFFDGTDDPNASIWAALDILLDHNNHDAVAIFSHTRTEPIKPPKDGRYKLCRRISGDAFGMQTRAGDVSDFDVSLFQRSAAVPGRRPSGHGAVRDKVEL